MKHRKKENHVAEGKDKYELDVDRMINEGMAGGTVSQVYGREQIGETHDLPKNDEHVIDEP
ncbi:hypothetical protein [Thalassobacillus hwangdonensis]|uniref:DUF4025 domain-containing protein n=1 Tax=Thalassobacillus hwangdonensis TaxID=546108 RepID=A0ABW3KW11_9BACI